MNHGSLFSGFGGFDLASEWMGWENVFQVENNNYCTKILNKNFPNVTKYGDIKEFDGTKYKGIIDIISGGFPCQPFSVAGKQAGKSDNRFLWPEMLRVIREIQPTWILGENVPGIIRMELENICTSLESEGYAVQPFIIPSASIGAWDKRERVWIIAYNGLFRQAINEKQTTGGEQYTKIPTYTQKQGVRRLPVQQRGQNKASNIDINGEIEVNPDNYSEGLPKPGHEPPEQKIYAEFGIKYGDSNITDIISSRRENGLYGGKPEGETRKCSHYFKKSDWWERNWIEVASELCRSNARVPHRMDRIKGLGNSVNPYVPFKIFKAIQEYENKTLNQNPLPSAP